MRTTAWIASLLVAGTAAAETSSFLPHPVAPEHGVSILSRSAAERLTGRTLLGEPAGSAVYGTIHVYAAFPYVEARYVHVTSDASWQRLLYGVPGEAPRAFGSAGSGPGQFGEPRGLAFAPDGRLFVADRGLGRVSILRLRDTADGPALDFEGQIDGFVQPLDVAVHDGGTPGAAADDRLLVADAGAQRLALYDLGGASPVHLADYGARGSGTGEFLYPRAVCIGRDAGRNDDAVYVADSGNHRVVRLRLAGAQFAWQDAVSLPLEATSVDSDHFGNVYLSMRRSGTVWKMSPRLEHVATYTGGATPLVSPRDVAIPFAWVHDHRLPGAAPAWRGQGAALVLEAWGEDTGVRRLDLGVEIASVERRDLRTLELVLTDAAAVHAVLVSKQGETSTVDLGRRAAGSQRVELDGLADAARVTLVAESQYDAARRDERSIELAALAPARLTLHQNAPNPFNPSTTIAFDVPAAGRARLEVFDVRGRHVRSLLDADVQSGAHTARWDGRDGDGRRVGSGIYFYRLEAANATRVRKMVLAQ
jgi:hypothetical protein